MAHHDAGHGGWWTPPQQGATGDGGGAGSGLDNRLVRDLIAALGASVVNTNNNLVSLGQMMANGQGQGDHGYRLFKPKKDVTKVTADGAEELMIEMAQFGVDLGELGVHP